MKLKYITHPQDINAHQIGEIEEAGGEHTPVVRVESDAVLSLGCAVPALIVLLDIGTSASVPDEIAQQCADLRIYSQVMSTAGGEIKRAQAYVAREGDDAAAKELLAESLAAAKAPAEKATRAAKKTAAKPAKKAAKKTAKKAAKKTAVKKTKKRKRAAMPRRAFGPRTPSDEY